MTLPFGCIVLAAGAGARFGAPKAGAALPDGSTFVEAVARTALAAGADPVVVVLPPAHPAPPGSQRVVNPDPLSEQITSLRLGLGALEKTPVAGVLAWPVDCVTVRHETVQAIITAASSSGAPVAVPVWHGKRGHPAYFAREAWPDLMAVTNGGARAVVRRYGDQLVEVPVGDRRILSDIDTKEALARILTGAEGA